MTITYFKNHECPVEMGASAGKKNLDLLLGFFFAHYYISNPLPIILNIHLNKYPIAFSFYVSNPIQ